MQIAEQSAGLATQCVACREVLVVPKSNFDDSPFVPMPADDSQTQQRRPLQNNQAFCFACGKVIDVRAEICPQCGVRQRQPTSATGKSRTTAGMLALFLGGLGVHRFYLGGIGHVLVGVIYLVFCWTFIPSIIAFVEALYFFCISDATFAANYADPMTSRHQQAATGRQPREQHDGDTRNLLIGSAVLIGAAVVVVWIIASLGSSSNVPEFDRVLLEKPQQSTVKPVGGSHMKMSLR